MARTFVTGSDGDWVRATERMIGAPIPRRHVGGFEPDNEENPKPRPSPRGNAPGLRPGGQKRSNRRSSADRRSSRRRAGQKVFPERKEPLVFLQSQRSSFDISREDLNFRL